MRIRVFAAVLAAVCAGVLVTAQQVPVFRSEANFVEVTVRVTDRDGKAVEGLTAADFEVVEDRRKQTVDAAFLVDLPTPWRNAAAPQPILYRPGLSSALKVGEGRVYLLYLNAVKTEHIVITRKLAHAFVEEYLLPEDVVAMWGQRRGLMTFTNDKARIHKAIDAFLGTNDDFTEARSTGDLGTISPAIGSALSWFSSVQGRKKSMLLFSAGWGGIGPVFSERQTVVSTQSRLVDRADVQIYAIDTRGLNPPEAHSALVAARPSNAADAAAGVSGELNASFDSIQNMRWLAEDSGGFAIVNHNDYQKSFRRIVDENSTYYVLGYQSNAPTSANWDYREISVKVVKAGLTGLKVQARKGYVAR